MTRPTLHWQVARASAPFDTVQHWTDESSYAMAVQTQRGREQELDRDEAGSATILARNHDRHFDPTVHTDIRPMKRVRLGAEDPSVARGYLRIDQSGTANVYCGSESPAPAGLNITGDIDVRAYIAATDWTPATTQCVVAKQASTLEGWRLELAGGADTGKLVFSWRQTGATKTETSTTTVSAADGDDLWIRVTLDVNNNAGGYDLKFWTSTDATASPSWVQLGATITGGSTTDIVDTDDQITIGKSSVLGHYFDGKVYKIEIRSGISGTLVASPDWTSPLYWWQDDWRGIDAQDTEWTLNGSLDSIYAVAATRYIWSGFALDWQQRWPNRRNARVQVTCQDAFRVLQAQKGPLSLAEAASGARIEDVLDFAGFGDERTIAAGQSTIIESELDESNTLLEHLQHVAFSENGRFFLSASGRPTFRDRHTELKDPYRTSLCTFGDAAGELPYITAEFSYGDDPLYNEASVSRAGGEVQTASDAGSQAAYLARTIERQNLLIGSDEEALSAAQWLVARYAEPQLRIRSLEIEPERDPGTLWPLVLAFELGDRITVKRRPPGGGSPISQESRIERIRHQIGPKRWRIIIDVSPADINDYWILEDPIAGVLEDTARLAY